MAVTVMAAIANYLRETIDEGLTDVLPDIDPYMRNTWKTSLGVYETQQRGGGIGRAFEAKHTYEAGLAGTQEWVSALGGSDASLSGASGGDGITVYGLPSAGWPSIADMAAGGTIQATYALVQANGGYPIPMHLLAADKLNAAIASSVNSIVRGAAKRSLLSDAHVLWKLNASNSIATFVGTSDTNSGFSTTPIALTLASGRIRSFYRGLAVSIFSDSAGLPNAEKNNSCKIFVVRVNPADNIIWVRTVSGTTSAMATGSTFHILPRNSRGSSAELSNSPNGLVDFHKASGTIAGNISLTSYPELASLVSTSQTGALTSDVLNAVIAKMMEDFGVELDTIVTTQGVVQGLVQNQETIGQLVRYEVQGEAIAVKAGYAPVKYVINGKEFRILVSPMCPKGHVWIQKLGDKNYVKYTPPKYPSTTTKSEFSGEIEFVGPLFGSNNEFMPQYATDGSTVTLTDKLMVPYVKRVQFGCRNPRAIHLSEFSENFGL